MARPRVSQAGGERGQQREVGGREIVDERKRVDQVLVPDLHVGGRLGGARHVAERAVRLVDDERPQAWADRTFQIAPKALGPLAPRSHSRHATILPVDERPPSGSGGRASSGSAIVRGPSGSRYASAGGHPRCAMRCERWQSVLRLHRACQLALARHTGPPLDRASRCHCRMSAMRLREIRVGCFGGGTGLPSLLGGLKTNPWLDVNAVVTMFDSGGSSGVLRDELGVLPPGDILRCALALARNESEARRVLLSRLPDARARPPVRSHRRQPPALDDGALQRRLPRGHRRPARAARLPRPRLAGERRAGVGVRRVRATARRRAARWRWTPSRARAGPSAGSGSTRRRGSTRSLADAIGGFEAIIIGPGSFYTSLMPPLLVEGMVQALAPGQRPGHPGGQPADRGPRHERVHRGRRGRLDRFDAIGRPVDVVVVNTARPSAETLARYAAEHKHPLPLGDVPSCCEVVEGEFWHGEIARHARRRLSYAVWSVVSRRLLQ